VRRIFEGTILLASGDASACVQCIPEKLDQY
jgi:hypothetical protein